MTTKATPGPWEFVAKLSGSENHKGFFIRAEKVTRNGKWALAEVQPGDEDGRLGEANARLIAAAPDLLHEVRSVLEWALFERKPLRDVEIGSLRRVIEKATGEQR
jgi:hypothetical protein